MGKKKGKNVKGRAALAVVSRAPPMYRAVSSVRRIFRYAVTSACSGYYITEAQFLSMPGGMCTATNTTLTALSVSVRLHRVTMYGPSPAAGSTSTISLKWEATGAVANANMMADLMFSDTSNNAAVSPYLSCAPPRGSRQSFWLTADNSGSDPWFGIEAAPVGTIVDFDLEFCYGEVPTIGQYNIAISTGTLGVLYWLVLNATGGSGVLTPVGLASTS